LAEDPRNQLFAREASITDFQSEFLFSEATPHEFFIRATSPKKEDPEFEGKTWLCKRDFDKDRTCTAVLHDGFLETMRESKPIPEGEIGCTTEVCSKLFEARFSKLAYVYEHEGD